MPLQVPPELKQITPYVRRAEELDRDKANPESRLVAYYCRQYAVHTGISLATSAAGKNCLGEILGSLEEEKAAMDSFTRDEAKFLCQKFAYKIFDKADFEDRDGAATKATAKTFYAAASFLEMLQQFYKDDDESDDIQEIRKRARYAKWKATTMLQAFREGRQPTPGEYGADTGEDDEEEEESPETTVVEPPAVETVVNDSDDGQPESEPTVPTEPKQREPEAFFVRPPSLEEEENDEQSMEVESDPPPAFDSVVPPPALPPALPPAPPSVHRPPVTFNPAPVAPPMPAPPTTMPQPPPEPETKKSSYFGLGKKKKKASKAQLADATELTRFALAALEDKNTDLAADRLKKALQVLGH